MKLIHLSLVCFACLGLATGLSSCIPLVAVGVGAGALVAGDRRLTETYFTDQANESRAADRVAYKFGASLHANYTCYNLKMLITGEAPDEATIAEVSKIVSNIPNVKEVVNKLVVGPPSSFTSRSNDALITTSVKTRFAEANKFAPNHVKVVTEAGTVYLLGIVTRQEADDAADIASKTRGVVKVVRVFDVRTDEEIQAIDSGTPATPPTPVAPGKNG